MKAKLKSNEQKLFLFLFFMHRVVNKYLGEFMVASCEAAREPALGEQRGENQRRPGQTLFSAADGI